MSAELVAVDAPQRPALEGTIRPAGHREAAVAEIDLVEKLVAARNGYKAALLALGEFYAGTGEGTKGGWVRTELADLDGMRKYRYLAEAEIAGPSLKAAVADAAADALYDEAMQLKGKFALFEIGKQDEYRLALEKFNRIIREHPTSDKIDDAAFQAGEIYASRHFRDPWRAVLYFQRAFQWDPDTPWPARLRAAQVLDRDLLERRTALELYHLAAEKEKDPEARKQAAARIAELSRPPR